MKPTSNYTILALFALVGIVALFQPTFIGNNGEKFPPALFIGACSLFILFAMIAIYYSRINRLYTIKQTEIDKNWQSISEQVKNHISANTLPIVAVTKALLKQNESAYFCQPAVMYKHQTTHYDKSGAGINLSIAKGVKVGTGGGRSRAVKDYVPISDGELVFTNTRVIFAGNLKSFECKLANLISYEAVGNGFIFQVGAKTHMAALSNARSHQSARAILEHLINKHLG